MSQNYDLDFLEAQIPSKRIRFPDGTEGIVTPPDVQTLIRVGIVIRELQKLRSTSLGDNTPETEEAQLDVLDAANKLLEELKNLVPVMKDKNLRLDQIVAIATLAMSMAETTRQGEMKARGISNSAKSKKNSA